jgi:hypothetical protein
LSAILITVYEYFFAICKLFVVYPTFKSIEIDIFDTTMYDWCDVWQSVLSWQPNRKDSSCYKLSDKILFQPMISGKINWFVHFTIQYLSLFSMGANKYEWKYNIKLRCRTTYIFGRLCHNWQDIRFSTMYEQNVCFCMKKHS